ncbi:MAG: transglutaminase-like domain-containing protein [Gemmatimonadota bacterium]|nr:transglutaminase-like domain-containing protein [Gemmatimonadota bacterium]
MIRRGSVAAVILLAWVAGLALLTRREFFRTESDLMRDAGARVDPGTVYYRVMQAGTQIGFASSRIDTTASEITMSDQLLFDVSADKRSHRGSARLTSRLSRELQLRSFSLELSPEIGPLRATGEVSSDTLLTLSIRMDGEEPEVHRIPLTRPLLLPTLVPMTFALLDRPTLGARRTFSVFDPLAMAPGEVTVAVRAESLFVVNDSASFDWDRKRWIPARRDTVRAWLVEQEGGPMSAWVDAQGRMVEAMHPGQLYLEREAYEVAFENWQNWNARAVEDSGDQDIQEATAIASSAPIRNHRQLGHLAVRLRDVPLEAWELDGGRQAMRGDTLSIRREALASLTPAYALPMRRGGRYEDALRPERLLQTEDSAIVMLAARIRGDTRNPRVAAERLARWVHDSLEKRISFSIPSATQVLRARAGDCNEHTQLYVALARAMGIPARAAAGLAYVGRKFYYHAWPEVFLGDWVAVDPTFGQFPADAAHLRFVIGGFSKQAELLRLLGRLRIDVVSTD